MFGRTLFVAAAVGGALAMALAPAGRAGSDGTLSLFNGTDTSGWAFRGDADKVKTKNQWVVGRCELDEKNPAKFKVTVVPPQASGGPAARVLINASGGVDLYTTRKFTDCRVEVEFMIPKGSNSGIYLMGQYEVQVLDSYGRTKLSPGDMGGIYSTAAPKVNACKKSGEWQTMVIDFVAPRFQGGKKVANAKFIKVVLNDQVIHENVEMTNGSTGGALNKDEVPEGPLMIQGDHGPIALRSVKVTPKAAKPQPGDAKAIQKVLDDQVVCWNKGDLQGFMVGYHKSNDITFYSGKTIHRGWDAMLDRYQREYQGEGKEMGKLVFGDVDIDVVSASSAVVRGRWELTMSKERVGGLFTLVMRRTSEGWRIVHDHTSH